jgi:hypothetical protein
VPGQGEERADYQQLQKVLCARCRVLGKDIQKARRLSAAHDMVRPMRASASSASFGNNTSAPSSSNSPKKVKEEGSGSGDSKAAADLEELAVVDVKVESESKIHSADSASDSAPDLIKGEGTQEETEIKEEDDGNKQRTEPLSPDYDALASLMNAHSPVPVPAPVSSLLDMSSSRIKLESMGIEDIFEEISASNVDEERKEEGEPASTPLLPVPSGSPPTQEEVPPIIMSGEDLTEDLKRRDRESHTAQERHSHSTPAPLVASVAVNGGSGMGSVAYMPAARCTDLAYGQIWMDIASQALLIPDALLQRDVLDALETLLRDAGRFFLCGLGEDDQHWDDFIKLQNVISFLVYSSHIIPFLFCFLHPFAHQYILAFLDARIFSTFSFGFPLPLTRSESGSRV